MLQNAKYAIHMLYIGIDLSDNFFDSCITDSQNTVLSTKRFDLSHGGFCSFIKLVHEHEKHSHRCIVGLENPRSRLVDFLAGRGYTVMLTNPNAISSYRSGARAENHPEPSLIRVMPNSSLTM